MLAGFYAARSYDVKIWKDKLWQGDAYHVKWNANNPYNIKLPSGHYEAYVDAVIGKLPVISNVISFDVKKDAPSIAKINADKSMYGINEKPKFKFEYDEGESVSIGIDKDGVRIAAPDVTGKNEYTFTPAGVGTYTAYLSVWNNIGFKDSEIITFTVDDKFMFKPKLVIEDKYKIQTEILNLNKSARCFAVSYDENNCVIEAKFERLNSGATQSDLALSKNKNIDYIKVYLWDENLRPISEVNILEAK